MSGTVTSKGWMAPLIHPLTKKAREDFCEELYDNNTNLHINLEGTLIYSEEGGDLEYGLTFLDVRSGSSTNTFLKALAGQDISINKEHMRPYTCTWYSGSDSDMGMMKIKEFMTTTPIR